MTLYSNYLKKIFSTIKPRYNIMPIIIIGIVLFDIIMFTIFKYYYYPFPNFSPDSVTYIDTARFNYNLTLWPVGYSKFLHYFRIITTSGYLLVLVQYTLLILSIAYLIITLHFILHVSKRVTIFMFIILTCNPITFHLANYISSDCLFTAISICWSSQLLWLLSYPSLLLGYCHGLCLLAAFYLRYNAFWYPLITIGTIALAPFTLKNKLIVLSICIILPVLFCIQNLYNYNKLIGKPILSAFGGWQLASNGLNGYAHTDTLSRKKVPLQFQVLHGLVNQHIDSIQKLTKRPDTLIGTYYLWENKGPLRRYLILNRSKENRRHPLSFKEWAQVAPLYMEYGRYLIKRYPIKFTKHFLYPNLIYYFVPPPEYLSIYNMGKNEFDTTIVSWFGYHSNSLPKKLTNKKIHEIELAPLISASITLLFVLSLMGYISTTCFSLKNNFNKSVILVFSIVFGNFVFSVFSSGIVLRYQIFTEIIQFSIATILLKHLIDQVILESKGESKLRKKDD